MNRIGCALALSLGLVSVGACGTEDLTHEPGLLATSLEVVDFEQVFLGSSETRQVSLVNRGGSEVAIEAPPSELAEGVFQLSLNGAVLRPNDEVLLDVVFAPAAVMAYESTLTLTNDSYNRPSLEIVVRGEGRSPDPCYGITCNTPPPSACLTTSTSRHYIPGGTCAGGACTYEPADEVCEWGCDFGTGFCAGDPCDGVTCYEPPPTTCLDADVRRYYEPVGTCSAGECSYGPLEEVCEHGCDPVTGWCQGDPCQGVTCQTPPGQCFGAQGVCVDGGCVYTALDAAPCSDGDACTVDDACSAGVCRANPKVCTTEQAPACITTSILRRWLAVGSCVDGGSCEFDHVDIACEFGCANGACNGDPCAGGCDDGNPCTADTCTPQGCSYPPNDGAACEAQNTTCPTGICVGGGCVPKSGEVCETTVGGNIPYCSQTAVPGSCTTDGECVVEDVPAYLQCGTCPGICLVCIPPWGIPITYCLDL